MRYYRTYIVMFKIHNDIRILRKLVQPAARLLACLPVCCPPLSAGQLAAAVRWCWSGLQRVRVFARAGAQPRDPQAQPYDVELPPPRAQGPNLSTHVCVMWQLVAPHKRKHIIKQVHIDGPTLPLLSMALRRDETVLTIPPAVDTLCARRVGNLRKLFLQTPFPSELELLVANSHSLDIPGHGHDRCRPSRKDTHRSVRNTLINAMELGS